MTCMATTASQTNYAHNLATQRPRRTSRVPLLIRNIARHTKNSASTPVVGFGRQAYVPGPLAARHTAVFASRVVTAAEFFALIDRPSSPERTLVLLDRDGVINVDRGTWVQDPKDFDLIPGIAHAIAKLNKVGHAVAVITNQSCVGRGLMSEETLDKIHQKMHDELALSGASVDKIYMATDDPESASDRRKPGPAMLLEAMADFGVDAENTVMVGDSLSDMQAAVAAGIHKRVLVTTGHGSELVAAEMEEWGLTPPVFVMPAMGNFGGLPPEVLPVSIHSSLSNAVKEVIMDVTLSSIDIQDEYESWGPLLSDFVKEEPRAENKTTKPASKMGATSAQFK